MSSAFQGTAERSSERHAEQSEVSIAEVLRTLSTGATGDILLALGAGPLRTKALTERVRGYTPRTIYRYLPRLAQLGLVEREEEATPSKVIHRLSAGPGSDLYELLRRFMAATMDWRPGNQLEASAWASLGLLADLWEVGAVEELSHGPRSPTELALATDGLSYHQVSRRATYFRTAGFLTEAQQPQGQRHRYALTDKVRRTMGLIAGVGRWRRRHLAGEDCEGLSPSEMATVLRTAAPLVRAARRDGDTFELSVVDSASVILGVDGDNWAQGRTEAWLAATLDGDPAEILMGKDKELVSEFLALLHRALWTASPS